MSKTIEQLRAQATQIEEATRRGENTQLRVGGLFNDIIDFISSIPGNEVVLGPLLQALNNSLLLNPSDGQTLTFSIMKDGWTFSDALTQLEIKLGQITSTVTSNYENFLQVKSLLQQEIEATDQRVRNYKTDYDNSQLEYHTWKSQTDTSISQYAVAIDKNTNDIVSISGRVDTAYDQLDFVTNNLDAADAALAKLFNLTGLDYEDPDQAYTASWLYKNRQGIYGAAATFDENGNILNSSVLKLTINGFETRVSNAEGQVSSISQTVDSIQLAVTGNQHDIDTLNDYITGDSGLLNRLGIAETKLATDDEKLNTYGSTLQVHDRAIAAVSAKFNPDGSLANTSGLVVSSDFSELFAEAYDDTGAVTTMTKLRADLTGVSQEVSNAQGQISQLSTTVDGIYGQVYDPNTGIGALNVKAGQVSMEVKDVDDNLKGVMELELIEELLDGDSLATVLSKANLKADIFDFNFTKNWSISANGTPVLTLNPNGDLWIKGTFSGKIDDTVIIGTGNKKMYIEAVASGAYLWGKDDSGVEVMRLGFMDYEGRTTSGLRLTTRVTSSTNSYSYYYNDMFLINGSNYWIKGFTTTAGSTLQFEKSGTTGFILRYDSSNKFYFYIPKERWYNYDTATPGCLYLDGDVVKYKTY